MKELTLKEEIREIHDERYSSIWETHPDERPKDPEPFEFDYPLKDKTGEEFECHISGFYNSEYEEITNLTILDEHLNDITELFNDKQTLRDIEQLINM